MCECVCLVYVVDWRPNMPASGKEWTRTEAEDGKEAVIREEAACIFQPFSCLFSKTLISAWMCLVVVTAEGSTKLDQGMEPRLLRSPCMYIRIYACVLCIAAPERRWMGVGEAKGERRRRERRGSSETTTKERRQEDT